LIFETINKVPLNIDKSSYNCATVIFIAALYIEKSINYSKLESHGSISAGLAAFIPDEADTHGSVECTCSSIVRCPVFAVASLVGVPGEGVSCCLVAECPSDGPLGRSFSMQLQY